MSVQVQAQSFSAAQLLDQMQGRCAGAGALASFVGYCRPRSGESKVDHLDLEYYAGFTEREIAAIAESVATRRALADLVIVHRTGQVHPDEAIVLVAALAGHRAEAFAAVEEIMDYLKTDAPFWKREVAGGGASWVEPTAEDHRGRDRWSRP